MMQKDCVIFGAWIPSLDRGRPYIDILKQHYGDCDIFVGINPGTGSITWQDLLHNSGLNVVSKLTDPHLILNGDASATQAALQLYSQADNNQYHYAHLLHTKGISHPANPGSNTSDGFSNFVSFSQKRKTATQFLESYPKYGGWGEYGQTQTQWFRSKQYDHSAPAGNCTMAQSVEKSTLEVHPNWDWYRFFPFKYNPLRTQWLLTFCVMKNFLLSTFINNCTDDFLNKHIISDLRSDRYFFETYVAQIVCRQGYLRHIDKFYPGRPGNRSLERQMIALWEKEKSPIKYFL